MHDAENHKLHASGSVECFCQQNCPASHTPPGIHPVCIDKTWRNQATDAQNHPFCFCAPARVSIHESGIMPFIRSVYNVTLHVTSDAPYTEAAGNKLAYMLSQQICHLQQSIFCILSDWLVVLKLAEVSFELIKGSLVVQDLIACCTYLLKVVSKQATRSFLRSRQMLVILCHTVLEYQVTSSKVMGNKHYTCAANKAADTIATLSASCCSSASCSSSRNLCR